MNHKIVIPIVIRLILKTDNKNLETTFCGFHILVLSFVENKKLETKKNEALLKQRYQITSMCVVLPNHQQQNNKLLDG